MGRAIRCKLITILSPRDDISWTAFAETGMTDVPPKIALRKSGFRAGGCQITFVRNNVGPVRRVDDGHDRH